MLTLSINSRHKGEGMACFLATTQLFGSLGNFVIGKLMTKLSIITQADKGLLFAANTAIPSLIAAVFFYIAGIYYAREKQKSSDTTKYAYRNRHLASMAMSRTAA